MTQRNLIGVIRSLNINDSNNISNDMTVIFREELLTADANVYNAYRDSKLFPHRECNFTAEGVV